MKWTYWLLFGLALVLVTGGVAMVRRQSKATAEDYFASVESRIQSGRYDREQMIQNLDQVLERAQASGNSDLTARVLLRRGRSLRDLGAYERAKADLLAAAAMRPTDPAVEDDLVDLEARAGDFNAALARVERMVELDPAKPHGRVLLGRLHRQAADKALAQGTGLLEQSLVAEASTEAVTLLSRSAALEPGDVQRIAIAHRLREILRALDDARVEEVLDIADRAARDLEAAREAWAESLAHGVETEAVTGLADLLQRAGRTDLAVDLATVTVRMPSMRSDPQFARTLMRALKELGRWRYAGEIAAMWAGRATPVAPDFLLECCAVLWRAGRAQDLQFAAQSLWNVGTTTQGEIAQLYMGLAASEFAARFDADAARQTDAAARTKTHNDAVTQWQTARQRLLLFTATKHADPFPRARAEAWRRAAQASRSLGELVAERFALNGYLALEPEEDGEMWLRLAEVEIASPNSGFRDPDLHFARGMSLLPARTTELMKRWHEIGALELRASGLDLEALRADLEQGRAYQPSADAPPFERYKLAELHASFGDWVRTGLHVRRLLEMVPGFVPGQDLLIRVHDGQDRERERNEVLFERVRRGGRTAEIDAILQEKPFEDLDARERLALMRADPERAGRILLASGLFRRGHVAEALATLGRIGTGANGTTTSGTGAAQAAGPGQDGRLLSARLHLAQREPERALEDLVALGQDLLPMPGGIETYVNAAIGASDHARLESLGVTLARRILRQVSGEMEPGAMRAFAFDRARALGVVDAMLGAGDGASAQPILLALDATPKTRGGDVVLRLVASAALRGEIAEARTALERAQAFETSGATDQVTLFLAALQSAGPEGRSAGENLSDLAQTVESSGYPMGPLVRIQNAVIQGKLPEARALLEARIAGAQEHDPWWNLSAFAAALLSSDATPPSMPAWMGANAASQARLLFAGPEGDRDPRVALAMLSAVRDPLGAPYVRAWLAQVTSESAGDLWPAFVGAALDEAQGALESLRRLHETYPDFGPAWDFEEAILAGGELGETQRAEFTRRRDARMGSAVVAGPRRLLETARAQRDAGKLDEALQSARAAVDADAWSFEARTLQAELLSRAGNDRAALAVLQDALGLAPPDDGRPWPVPRTSAADMAFVRAYLDVIARLRDARGATLPRARLEPLLKTLARERPDDPRVVLALAELDVGADARNASMGVLRAYARLDAFRAAPGHKGVSIEKMMEGSVREWARFYSRLDAKRADAFLEQELELDPTVLDTWIELAHAAEMDGRAEEALKRMELCARLAPRGDVLREVLRLRARGDVPPEEIEARVRGIVEAEGAAGPDAELVLLQARCYLNLGPRFHGKVMELVRGLEAFRNISPEFRRRHSVLWATVLMSRGTPEDVEAARPLLEEVRGKGDAYERGYVDALWGFAQGK